MRALVVGGTSGIGHQIARTLAARGEEVVLTGRDAARAHAIASEIGAVHRGLALDLTRPQEISGQLSEVGAIDHLVLAAVERDRNSVRQYDVAAAVRAATLKIVGYTAVVSALVPRLTSAASIVVLGGLARDWPYPGSTTVSMVNGGVTSMVRTLAIELAPVRVNAIHPGAVGDSPIMKVLPRALIDQVIARTPTGHLVTMADIAAAALMLLDNPGINGVNLDVDAGFLLT
jgi:NAD(P)-dependent dehydrogenase (short-subunit alcohol dehydrogenase family)